MKAYIPELAVAISLWVSTSFNSALAEEICKGFGPQAPRDIASARGESTQAFTPAPPASQMNLCNIHIHKYAEHKGPGFSTSAGSGEHGGYRCNETDRLTAAELKEPIGGQDAFEGVAPGDSVEVHWAYTSCNVGPGEGLGACLSETCANPQLRVEAQVFLVVNDASALDLADFAYAGPTSQGLHQPKRLPAGTGEPVVYAGSTTGPSYSQSVCSPFQVTWSVRPRCAKLDIASLHRWARNGNPFDEEHAHGTRALITAEELLAPITE